MSRDIRPILGALLLTICATGCKPKTHTAQAEAGPFFQTPFQTESQFIVHSIVSDLAEQVCYAAAKRLPEKDSLSVTITEKADSPADSPAYEVAIQLGKNGPLKLDLKLTDAIWSPTVYEAVTRELARVAGLPAVTGTPGDQTSLVLRLLDSSAEAIAREDEVISTALEKNFRNADLHERAAVLLGGFLLRDHSGRFYDIRLPLSRMTAHLAMARYLHGTSDLGLNGRMAEAMLLTLIGNEAQALEKLNGIKEPALEPMVRALRARNNGDYRPLDQARERSRFENIEWFCAKANLAGPELPWEQLTAQDKRNIDFVRVVNCCS